MKNYSANLKLSTLAVCSLLLSPQFVLAQLTDPGAIQAQVEKDSGPVGSGVGEASTNEAGRNAAAQNEKGSGMSAMMSTGLTLGGNAVLASTCPTPAGCSPYGYTLLGMGILSGLQSGASSGAASGADMFADQFDAVGAGQMGLNAGKTGKSNPYVTPDIAKMRETMKQMANNPNVKIDYEKGTLTTKDGKTYNATDFANPAAMAAAGFDPSTINAAMAFAKKREAEIVQKYAASDLGYEGGAAGGGGAGLGGGGAGQGTIFVGGAGAGSGLDAAGFREPANMAGLQKDYNGEPIGVAGDSLFQMMTRRYEVKKKQDAFFEEHEVKLRK